MNAIIATRLVFFIAGFGMAAWAPLVPLAQARTGLSAAGLGLLLLCIGVGSIVALPQSGLLSARLGCRRIIVAAALLICATLPLLAMLADPVWLGLAMLAFGAGVGSIDCVMNIQAVIVEREAQRPLMSGFHGLYSLGGIAGSGGMSALLGAHVRPQWAVLLVVGIILAAIALAAPHLLARKAADGARFAVPRGVVLLIGLCCCVMFLAEGGTLDWSAVSLTQIHGLDAARAGLGYTAFATTMTLGRLCGDAVVHRIGGRRVLIGGPAIAAAGLAVAVLSPTWQAALLGFALVGIGCSNVVPVLYSAAGRQTSMPESTAIPAITTLGYTGILSGPALIGFAAHLIGLPGALLCVACSVLSAALLAPTILRKIPGG